MNIEHFRLAFSGLKKRKVRSWLTMIGIFIGIASVVALIGLGEGLRTAITGQFGFLGTDILGVQASGSGFAGPPGEGAAKPLTDDLAEKLSSIPGVEIAFNRYIESGTLEFNNVVGIGYAMSYPEGEARKVMEKMMNFETEEGRLIKEGDGRKVLLGNSFLDEGMFGKPIHAGDRVLINGISFDVVGVLKKKGSFIFDSAVMINEKTMIRDLKEPGDNSVNVISVKVKDEDRINEVKADVEKLMRKERGVKEGEEDFEVSTPQQALETLNSTLFAVQIFVTIIAVVSLLVGGIGIMNTMYTSVLERTKEIGIMKSIGAKNSTIFSLFFIESGLLGMVGGLIGIAIGMVIAYGFAAVGRLALGSELIQAKIGIGLILGALAFSFVLGTIFGVLPAVQASRLQPVESLRSAK